MVGAVKENGNAIHYLDLNLERIHFHEWLEDVGRREDSKKKVATKFKNEIAESGQSSSRDVEPEDSFLYLLYFLEITARRSIPNTQGRLPTEIYRMIVADLPNAETYRACMNVSILFRVLCQQELRVMDNFVLLQHNGLCGRLHSELFKTVHLPTDNIQEMQLRTQNFHNVGGFPSPETFKVVIGSQRDRKSLLHDVEICFEPVNKIETWD